MKYSILFSLYYHYYFIFIIYLYNFSSLCLKINDKYFFRFFYFLTNIYALNFGKWNINFLILSKLFLRYIDTYFTNRARLLVLALLYQVFPFISKWQYEIFSTFVCILYNILIKHDLHSKVLRIFTRILTIYNGNAVHLFLFSLVEKNLSIHPFIHSLLLELIYFYFFLFQRIASNGPFILNHH